MNNAARYSAGLSDAAALPPTKLVGDVMSSTSQIMEGMKESTGIDLGALLAGFVGGKAAASDKPAE